MFEYFFATLQNFRAHKLRSILSLLGIIIGIMTVVIITTLGSSMYGSLVKILKSESSTPPNFITVQPQWSQKTKRVDLIPNEKYKRELLSNIKKIKNVFYTNEASVTILKGSAELNKKYRMQMLTGVEQGYLNELNTKLEQGTFFSLSDFAQRRQKAIVSAALAQKLFPEGSPVGKKFSITIPSNKTQLNGERSVLIFYFEVIGVVAPTTGSSSGELYGSKIYVPRSFVTSLKHAKTGDNVFAVMRDENDFSELKQSIEKFSDKFAGTKDSVYVYSSKQMMQQLNSVLTSVQIVLSAVAFISLFVGGINIMNIMIATVTERKKEIGIRKALGATNTDITQLFLVEALTQTLFGSLLGACFGIAISYVVIGLIPLGAIVGSTSIETSRMDFILNIYGIAIAFVVSIGVGVFFGLYPAIKAAKLDPIVALS